MRSGTKGIVALVFLVGLVLRIFHLDSRPLGFTWDEAALGYNAYSLLKTGRDEHGQILPIVFESFGDYKPGLYIYFTTFSVGAFGLNEFAARLPSAVFGSLFVLVIFVFVRRIFSLRAAMFAMIFAAINPWALHFSRGAWEANIAICLTLVAVTLFTRRRLGLSGVFFGLTFLSYHGSKLFTPLLVAALVVVSRKKIVKPIALVVPAAILAFLSLPILLGVSTQSGRFKVYSVFSYTRSVKTVSELLTQDRSGGKTLVYYLFHSEPLDQLRGIFLRYVNHISPRFLFFTGDWSNARHSTVYQGYLYLPELITLVVGVVYMLRRPTKCSHLVFVWLFLAAIPAALSRDIVSGVRSLPMVVPLVVIGGVGAAKMAGRISTALIWSIFMGFFFVNYLDLYYIHSPQYSSGEWLSAYGPAMQTVRENYQRFSRVVISDKLGQPYIFTLFYLQIPPSEYQGQAVVERNSQGDVSRVTSFGRFVFRPIFYPADRGLADTLLVGDQYELPQRDLDTTPNIDSVWQTTLADGKTALTVVGLK